jgi:hypothetical protein
VITRLFDFSSSCGLQTPFCICSTARTSEPMLTLVSIFSLVGAGIRQPLVTSFETILSRRAARERIVVVSPSLDLMNVGCCSADGRTFEDLRDQICTARDQGGWLIYVIHGVSAGTHTSFVESDIHEQLLDWLASQQQIWVRPFIDVANWVREWQQKATTLTNAPVGL